MCCSWYEAKGDLPPFLRSPFSAAIRLAPPQRLPFGAGTHKPVMAPTRRVFFPGLSLSFSISELVRKISSKFTHLGMPKNTILEIISRSVQDDTYFISLFVVCHVLGCLERLALTLSHLQPFVRPNPQDRGRMGRQVLPCKCWSTHGWQKILKRRWRKVPAEGWCGAGSDCDGHGKDPAARGDGGKPLLLGC